MKRHFSDVVLAQITDKLRWGSASSPELALAGALNNNECRVVLDNNAEVNVQLLPLMAVHLLSETDAGSGRLGKYTAEMLVAVDIYVGASEARLVTRELNRWRGIAQAILHQPGYVGATQHTKPDLAMPAFVELVRVVSVDEVLISNMGNTHTAAVRLTVRVRYSYLLHGLFEPAMFTVENGYPAFPSAVSLTKIDDNSSNVGFTLVADPAAVAESTFIYVAIADNIVRAQQSSEHVRDGVSYSPSNLRVRLWGGFTLTAGASKTVRFSSMPAENGVLYVVQTNNGVLSASPLSFTFTKA